MNDKFDTLIRPAALFAILLLFATTWGTAGPSKLMSGPPPYFVETFGKTFLATFPGLTVAFYSIALAETGAFLLALLAMIRREFMPDRTTFMTQLMLVASLFIFVQLGFGQRMALDFASAANLFFYFAGTLVALDFVRRDDDF